MSVTSQREKQRIAAHKFQYRQAARKVVIARWEANHCRCEGCGREARIIEVAHLVGKGGHIIADKYASTPELMMALCCAKTWGGWGLGCHESIDRGINLDKQAVLRWQCAYRFARAHGLEQPSGNDVLGVIRAMVKTLEEREKE